MDQNEPLIVGFAETAYTVASGRSVFDLAGDVHAQLLESTTLDNGAIDGLVACASTSGARPSQNCTKWPAALYTVGELR